ncbi:MAG: PD-(D/E)XK nuclease family protein [bacterium]|nr:PD-(D/E)XK nuclease family protein [bacterium]
MRSKLSSLIKEPEFEKLELLLRTPNIFKVLKIEDKEIRHSNFLAWLLDPNEGHSLSYTYLKWFLKDIFAKHNSEFLNEFSVDELNLYEIKVLREYKNIDILVIGEKFIICVENKIYSSEHSQQLERYRTIINNDFKSKEKELIFVFLTIDGISPIEEEDKEKYITYSYNHIEENLRVILELYRNSLSDKVRTYIEDYSTVLRRIIMKEDKDIEIAKKIYLNHKEALDFIFENKPDKLTDVQHIFEEEIIKNGYIVETSNKGYARFLTKKLHEIIPRTGIWWKNKESFLFEIDFWPKKVTLKSVISPGDERVREILNKAVSEVEDSSKPKGTTWLVHHSNLMKFDVTDEKSDDEIRAIAKTILENNKNLINKIENSILRYSEELKPN